MQNGDAELALAGRSWRPRVAKCDAPADFLAHTQSSLAAWQSDDNSSVVEMLTRKAAVYRPSNISPSLAAPAASTTVGITRRRSLSLRTLYATPAATQLL